VAKVAFGAQAALIVSFAPVAYTAVLGDVSAWGECTGTGDLVGPVVGPAVVSEQPVGCRRAGLACKHSWAAAGVLARGTAGEVRGSSWVGGRDPRGLYVSSVATSGVQAAARVLDAGTRSVWVEKQRA
jgi:hypothetical protein